MQPLQMAFKDHTMIIIVKVLKKSIQNSSINVYIVSFTSQYIPLRH